MDGFKSSIRNLHFDFCAQEAQQLGKPRVERRPSRTRDKVTVDKGIGHREIDVRAASDSNVRSGGRIGAALLPLQDSCRGQNLRCMANGGDRLIGLREVADDYDDTWIEANVFRRPATGDDESVVLFGLDLVESSVERKIVATFFGVGLITFEIVDAGGNDVSGFFARTDGMDGVSDHQQRLK